MVLSRFTCENSLGEMIDRSAAWFVLRRLVLRALVCAVVLVGGHGWGLGVEAYVIIGM